MKRKKRKLNPFYNFNLTRFDQVVALGKLYQDGMPLGLYTSFLNGIKIPELKKYFISVIKKRKESINDVCDIPKEVNNKHQSKSINKIRKTRITISPVKKIVEVSPQMFQFVNTESKKSRLFYYNYSCFFLGRKEWFTKEILNNINRKFKIQISNDDEFKFYPLEDKYEFEKLLKSEYEKEYYENYNKELRRISYTLEWRIKEAERKFKEELRTVRTQILFEKFTYYKNQRCYSYALDFFNFSEINKSTQKIFELSFLDILNLIDDLKWQPFYDDLKKRYGSGFKSFLNLEAIFPRLKTTKYVISIPKEFAERYLIKNSSIKIELKYNFSFNEGYITGLYFCNDFPKRIIINELVNDKAIFHHKTGESITKILLSDELGIYRKEMFYSAYQIMFNKTSDVIEKHIHELNQKSIFRTQHHSKYNTLLKFDENNPESWIWLSDKIKTSVYQEAYVFIDMNRTYSNQWFPVGDYRPPGILTYIAVEKEETIYWGKQRKVIQMYAFDSTKSIYTFYIEPKKIKHAIFAIWSYFSSFELNKREKYEFMEKFMKLFGISGMIKSEPLKFYSYKNYLPLYTQYLNDWVNEF